MKRSEVTSFFFDNFFLATHAMVVGTTIQCDVRPFLGSINEGTYQLATC